jgi:D-inositol-3-phosphate glycosyltransferase
MHEFERIIHEPARAPVTVERVALLSVHTCPLDQPGTGDSGGMNVYVRQVARRLAEMGVAVDIFSRWAGNAERVREMDPGVRVIHLEAGPAHAVPKDALGEHLCQFFYSLMQFESDEASRLGVERMYDAVHSHYWLSGKTGRQAAERWRVPLIHSFHTLGRVKNLTLAPGDRPESASRIASEERIVADAECILAPTADEAADLARLYGARADRVRVVTPGVDTEVFTPGDREAAKRAMGFEGRTVILFAGRLQLLKSPDVAVRTIASLARARPALDPVLVVLGGPSGNASVDPASLEKLAASLGVADRVYVREPVPHASLPQWYRGADAVLVPSRNESFGLVALEASACGTPVVATDVGGLRTAVRDGITGVLVPGGDPEAFAAALGGVLGDPERARAMGEAGARYARRYDWRRAANGLLAVYEEQASAYVAR